MDIQDTDGKHWELFIVYGGWEIPRKTDPLLRLNFFLCRIPKDNNRGDIPWTRVLVPALNRLVKRVTLTPQHKRAPFWDIDGDMPTWETKTGARRFEWQRGWVDFQEVD